MPNVLIYLTASHKQEALALARALLESRLIACANIIDGATSLYRWEGVIQEAAECIVIAKSTAANVEAITERVKALHSYQCPCVVSLPITDGNAEFLEWIGEEVKK